MIKLKPAFSLFLLAGTLFSASGCASSVCIYSRISDGNPEGEIYPATRTDAHVMNGLWHAGSWAILGEPFVILDIPFSLVTDTLILPYDIYCAKQRVDNRFKAPPRERQQIPAQQRQQQSQEQEEEVYYIR